MLDTFRHRPYFEVMVSEILNAEYRYFQEHEEEFVREHLGKVIVLKDQTVIGSYATIVEAYVATSQDHALGTFMIRQIVPRVGTYKQVFHAHVMG